MENAINHTSSDDIVTSDRKKARKAVIAAYQGTFIDLADQYVPVIALASAMVYFQSPAITGPAATLIYFSMFAATMLGRPLGSLIFGPLSDRLGRRRVSLISVAGFSTITLIISLLPGYESIGFWAPTALIVLRFITGIFIGGEYSAALPLAYEYTEKRRRGFLGGILQGANAVSYAFISIIVLVVLAFAPDGSLESPYVQWGWRIPFVFVAFMGFAYFLYRLKELPESELWRGSARPKTPVRTVLSSAGFWQVFVLMTGLFLCSNSISSTVPGFLTSQFHNSGQVATWTVLITQFFLMGAYLIAGAIGQKYGRRKTLIGYGIFHATISACVWWAFVTAGKGNLQLVLAVLAQILVAASFAVVNPYVNERFSTSVRSTGFGLGWSMGVIIPAFFAFYMNWLSNFMPYTATPAVLLAIGGILVAVGAFVGPETNDIDIAVARDAEVATTTTEKFAPDNIRLSPQRGDA